MTTLLIDTDFTAYQAVASAEEEIHWQDEIWTVDSDLSKAKTHFDKAIKQYKDALGISEYKCCFSDKVNFRKELNPSYKNNRKARKPVGYSAFKEWVIENHPSVIMPTLEGDDVLGILQTKLKDTIIVSADKDMGTIPGRWLQVKIDGNNEIKTVTDKEADYNFLMQSLTGDATDGYAGLPGTGPVKAKALLDKHGACWKTVEDAYLKAGLTAEDALLQARMARILRDTDWDFEKEEVKLWKP